MHVRLGCVSLVCTVSMLHATHSGCNTDAIPLGKSRLTAVVDGVADTFEVQQAEMYYGLHVRAISRSHALCMELAEGHVGWFPWGGTQGDYLEIDTTAVLDGFPAVPGSGGFMMNSNDRGSRKAIGTFYFSTYDTTRQDSVRVRNGRFTLYYTLGD